MSRIKVTGYLNTEELDDDFIDEKHSSGLSEKGYDEVTGMNARIPFKISDLEDIEVEAEE